MRKQLQPSFAAQVKVRLDQPGSCIVVLCVAHQEAQVRYAGKADQLACSLISNREAIAMQVQRLRLLGGRSCQHANVSRCRIVLQLEGVARRKGLNDARGTGHDAPAWRIQPGADCA